MYAHFEGTSQELADLQNDVSAAKTALELHREFNIQYANVAAHRNPTFSMYEYLMEKYEALNKQRIAEGIEPLKLSALEARCQELKSGSLSTSESLAFIERCLKTSEVGPIRIRITQFQQRGEPASIELLSELGKML
mgnify:CR=1 FL=1